MKKTSPTNKNINANDSKHSNDKIYDLFIAEFKQLENLRKKIVSWDLPSKGTQGLDELVERAYWSSNKMFSYRDALEENKFADKANLKQFMEDRAKVVGDLTLYAFYMRRLASLKTALEKLYKACSGIPLFDLGKSEDQFHLLRLWVNVNYYSIEVKVYLNVIKKYHQTNTSQNLTYLEAQQKKIDKWQKVVNDKVVKIDSVFLGKWLDRFHQLLENDLREALNKRRVCKDIFNQYRLHVSFVKADLLQVRDDYEEAYFQTYRLNAQIHRIKNSNVVAFDECFKIEMQGYVVNNLIIFEKANALLFSQFCFEKYMSVSEEISVYKKNSSVSDRQVINHREYEELFFNVQLKIKDIFDDFKNVSRLLHCFPEDYTDRVGQITDFYNNLQDQLNALYNKITALSLEPHFLSGSARKSKSSKNNNNQLVVSSDLNKEHDAEKTDKISEKTSVLSAVINDSNKNQLSSSFVDMAVEADSSQSFQVQDHLSVISPVVGLEDNDTIGFQEVVKSKKDKVYKESKNLDNSSFEVKAVPSTKKLNKSVSLKNKTSTTLKKIPLSSTSHIKAKLNVKKITAANKEVSETNSVISRNPQKETAWAKPLVIAKGNNQTEEKLDSLGESQSKKVSLSQAQEMKMEKETVITGNNSSTSHSYDAGTSGSQKEIKEFLGKIAPHKTAAEIERSVKPYVPNEQNITYVPALIQGEPALVPVDTGREIYYLQGNKGITPQLEISSLPVVVQPVVYVPVYSGFGFAQNENFSQSQTSPLQQGFFQNQNDNNLSVENDNLNQVSSIPIEKTT